MPTYCENPELIKINKIHSFFKADFKEDYVFKGERHNWWEMVFVINGNVGITADSHVYTLERGQAVIHRPDEFHKIGSGSLSHPTVIVISFSAEKFPEPNGRIFSLNLSQLEEIQSLFELSFKCFERDNIYIKKPQYDTSIIMQQLWLRLELFIFSVVCGTDSAKSSSVAKGLKSAELYSAAVKFMEQNLGSGCCTEDIAASVSISSAYLKKIFMKYSGCGVMQYYNHLKARVACEYLAGGKSVKETADLLGFSDQNYFSIFFKRLVGKSPTAFKKGE